ncbi:MAG TPA: Gfo/Idh/MocA family oxidoreductase [Bryobacteraceae bacterium]|nr:Gfo/Idh/MocA family oxidoreductase [Bryobacteraceae bacterium]
MINVGIVGCGYWGPNLIRAFTEVSDARVIAICDISADHLAAMHRRYPALRTTTNFDDLLAAPDLDAIVIATPVATHFDFAMAALRSHRHVLVEKPMASSSDDAARLVDEAARQRLTLMVDHPFIYSSAVRKIGELIRAGDLGDLYYYDSVRINLGRFQSDVNVLWDLAAHDLSILDYLIGTPPARISATGARHLEDTAHNIAYLTLFYDSGLLAHAHVNWLAPLKVRRTLIGGSRRMIVYDELEPSEKVKIYDSGAAPSANDDVSREMRIGYRTGDMWAPRLEVKDALETAAAHFIACIAAGTPPLSGGESGLRVVRQLEAATQSLYADGRPVPIVAEQRK